MGCLNSKPWFSIGLWITWDRAGSIGGKWRLLVGKVGEWCVESRHLEGYSPHLCRLRTVVLAPMSKYWTYQLHIGGDMGPVSLVACCWQMFGFLHSFIVWLEREIGYGLVDWTAGVLWIMSGALFLGSIDSIQLCRWLTKGCYALTAWDMYGLGPYADRA
jgi:hypothetical protein